MANELAWIPAVQQFSQYLQGYNERQKKREDEEIAKTLLNKYGSMLREAVDTQSLTKITQEGLAAATEYGVDITQKLSQFVQLQEGMLKEQKANKDARELLNVLRQTNETNRFDVGGMKTEAEIYQSLDYITDPLVKAKAYEILTQNRLSEVSRIYYDPTTKEQRVIRTSINTHTNTPVQTIGGVLKVDKASNNLYVDLNNDNIEQGEEAANTEEIEKYYNNLQQLQIRRENLARVNAPDTKVTQIKLKDGRQVIAIQKFDGKTLSFRDPESQEIIPLDQIDNLNVYKPKDTNREIERNLKLNREAHTRYQKINKNIIDAWIFDHTKDMNETEAIEFKNKYYVNYDPTKQYTVLINKDAAAVLQQISNEYNLSKFMSRSDIWELVHQSEQHRKEAEYFWNEKERLKKSKVVEDTNNVTTTPSEEITVREDVERRKLEAEGRSK